MAISYNKIAIHPETYSRIKFVSNIKKCTLSDAVNIMFKEWLDKNRNQAIEFIRLTTECKILTEEIIKGSNNGQSASRVEKPKFNNNIPIKN